MNPRRGEDGLGLLIAALAVGLLAAACSSADAESAVDEKVWSEDVVDRDAIHEMNGECYAKADVAYEVFLDGSASIGSASAGDTPESVRSMQALIDECDERLAAAGLVPDPDKRRNPAEIDLQYKAWIRTDNCLQEHGWPTVDVPSRETFDDPDDLPSLYGPVIERFGESPKFGHVIETCPYTY